MTKPEFVLVHGGGHGSWCWYKLMAIMEESGYKATALDLASSGIDKASADTITTVEEHAAPLTAYVSNASSQVILVGHSLSGIVISYVMEKHPDKVAKAIFITAFMPRNNQSMFDNLSPEFFPAELAEECFGYTFGNGSGAPPTSAHFSSSWDFLSKHLYNKCPKEDIFLAKSLLRSFPMPIFQKPITLSDEKYGSCRRFFIKTGKDALLIKGLQQNIIDNNPPEAVFDLEESDHSPFLSFPNELATMLLHISSL